MSGERIKFLVMTAIVLAEELLNWIRRKQSGGEGAGHDEKS
jgi:hypothetical protein